MSDGSVASRHPLTRPVTMQDVASRAGVSAQTVSNVVNGRSSRVGPETIDRVTRAIDELGYRLNQSARSLRTGRNGIVGLGLPVFASEYYGELAERLATRFADRGIRLVTENTGGDISAEIETLAASRLESYDGFVLAVASESTDLARLLSTKPIVLLGERDLSTRFDHVLMDNVDGGRLATSHLIERGATRIVALGGSLRGANSVHTLRTRGYLDAHAEAGLPVLGDLVVEGGLDMTDGYAGITSLVARGVEFDAVFALTDSSAFGALRALHESRRRVPDDVQVVGFDNVRASAFTSPALTSVEPGNDWMADTIVQLMSSRLSWPLASSAPQRVVARARLVRRESTRG